MASSSLSSLLLLLPLFFFFFFFLLTSSSSSNPCSNNNTTSFQIGNTTRVFEECFDLGVQGATLAWSLNATNNSIEIVFKGSAPSSSGWVGWGLNPQSLKMSGTQAFIAFLDTNGQTTLNTYNVTHSVKKGGAFLPGPIDLNILDQQVVINDANTVIYVNLKLAPNQSTVFNHVWSRGPSVDHLQPSSHSLASIDLQSLIAIDMLNGQTTSSSSDSSSLEALQNVHGVINTLAWGILFPVGVAYARYLRPFSDPLWFYLHVSFQCSAYVLGGAGWATGLILGSNSVGIVRLKHRAIGTILFSITTLQVMALLLRPKKDHRIRKLWNWYHHSIGYSILILSIINILEGFDILPHSYQKWRYAYIGALVSLGMIIIILEIVTWSIVLSKKKAVSGKHYIEAISNGHNNEA